MNIICSKEKLVAAVNIVQKAIPAISKVQILECILLKTNSDDKLVLTATDSEFTIEHKMEVKVFEAGGLAVDAKLFGEIIRRIYDVEIELLVEGKTLRIKSESTDVNISGFSAESFPDIPAFRSGKNITGKPSGIF